MRIEDLKCCGNCELYGIDSLDDENGNPICLYGFAVAYHSSVCKKWSYDEKKYEDRL